MGDFDTMTAYTRRTILVVTATDRDAANIQVVTIDPDTGGDKTFGAPLSTTGNDPPTHYACSTVIKPATLATVEALQASTFPTGSVYRGHNEYDDEPAITRWTFDEVLTDLGLARIETDLP